MNQGTRKVPKRKLLGDPGYNAGSKKKLQARLYETQALTMRLAGDTYEQIAQKLHVTRMSACNFINRVLDRENADQKELVPRCRRLEIRRLDTMNQAIWKQVQKGNLSAIGIALKIAERRARLCGLDAALNINHSGTVATVSVEAFRQMMIDANAKPQIDDGTVIDIEPTTAVQPPGTTGAGPGVELPDIPEVPDGRKVV